MNSYSKVLPSIMLLQLITAQSIRLNNGQQQPAVAFGTMRCFGPEGVAAMKTAVDAGYRQFDTAQLYQNEEYVGQALREKIAEGVVKREDLYVVTKLWNADHKPEDVEPACRLSLKKLGLEYVDLYLMHWPMAFNVVPGSPFGITASGETDNTVIDYLDTWRAMEKLVDLGLVKSIGVSNFNSQQLDRLLANCTIKPVTNQVEVSPNFNQKKLIKFCKERDITVMAYFTLALPITINKEMPKYFTDAKFAEIAQKYNKSIAQVALRYSIEIGAIPLSKSLTKSRIYENIDIFDFSLTADEIAYIDTFNTGERVLPYSESRNNVHYPFAIEF